MRRFGVVVNVAAGTNLRLEVLDPFEQASNRLLELIESSAVRHVMHASDADEPSSSADLQLQAVRPRQERRPVRCSTRLHHWIAVSIVWPIGCNAAPIHDCRNLDASRARRTS